MPDGDLGQMRKFWMIAGVAMTMAGCVDATSAPTAQDCGAAQLQSLLGQPQAVLNTMKFSQPLRVIPPMGRVTMDYWAHRLNIDVDARGVITAVRCG